MIYRKGSIKDYFSLETFPLFSVLSNGNCSLKIGGEGKRDVEDNAGGFEWWSGGLL